MANSSSNYLINGREYEWADMCLNIGGIEIRGFRNVEYKESQKKEVIYGKGNKPLSVQHGTKSYSGSITLTQSEILGLKETSAGKSLLDIQVDIVVSYVPEGSSKIVTDKIIGVEFTDLDKKMKQGDTSMEIDLPFIALDIQ